jgi:hypothetical protein
MSPKVDPQKGRFPPELLKQSKQKRRKYFEDLVIRHPLLTETFDAVSEEIQQAKAGSLIFVFGAAGTGKSTLATKIVENVTSSMLAELQEDRGRYPIVLVEAWAPTSGNYDFRDLYRSLLEAMREPCIDNKLITESDNGDGNWIETCASVAKQTQPNFVTLP